jgi:hypothetical protein
VSDAQPTAPTCPCGAPIPDQGWICRSCTGRMVADLAVIPDLLAELDTTITRQARITTPAKGNGDKPLPYDTKASAAFTALNTAIHGWTRILAEEAGVPLPPPHSYVTVWLSRRADDIRMREWAEEMAHDIDRAVREGWHSIDRPEERYYAGPCHNEVNDPAGLYLCPQILWAKLTAAHVRCRSCKAEYDAHERRAWLLSAASDVEETASVVASALTVMTRTRVTASTIRTWASRGILHARGVRGDAKLYRVQDVIDAMNRPAPTADEAREAVGHAA